MINMKNIENNNGHFVKLEDEVANAIQKYFEWYGTDGAVIGYEVSSPNTIGLRPIMNIN